MQYLNILDSYPQLIGGNLGKRGLGALAVRRHFGVDLDLTRGLDADPRLTGFHFTSTARGFDHRGHPDANE